MVTSSRSPVRMLAPGPGATQREGGIGGLNRHRIVAGNWISDSRSMKPSASRTVVSCPADGTARVAQGKVGGRGHAVM